MTALEKLRLELDAAKGAAALVADRINEIERALGEISGPVYEADAEGLVLAAREAAEHLDAFHDGQSAMIRERLRIALREFAGERSAVELAIEEDGVFPFEHAGRNC